MKSGIIVHGGAWDIPDDLVADHLSGIENAISYGHKLIERGEKALDIVEKVIILLEDDPTFDAGKGSFLNAIGEVEMDAIIADDQYNIGAIAALQNIKNPIKVARKVLDNKGPVLLAGKGANLFAQQQGFQSIKPTDLLVGRELTRYEKLKESPSFIPKDAFKRKGSGTVGTVVLDNKGRGAVAVSTGGTPKKAPSRVGDTPLFGAGAYIQPNSIGVAATGYGEDLIKTLISKSVHQYYQETQSVQVSTNKAIEYLTTSIKGLGGVIALGKKGFGLAWNTPRMAFGVQTDEQEAFVGIEHKDKKELLETKERDLEHSLDALINIDE